MALSEWNYYYAQIASLICFILINVKLLFLHDFPRSIDTAHDNVQFSLFSQNKLQFIQGYI